MVLRDKGQREARVLTVAGEIVVERRYFWRAETGGRMPSDESLGITGSRISPGAMEILCRLAMNEDFVSAAEDARRIGGLPIGKERLRQAVEAEGAKVAKARESGELKASWTADEAVVEGTSTRRVYAGIDGVMAPMVTQAEKDKRRRDQTTRRQQWSRQGVGNIKPLAPARPGHEERFREMKIGVFYDQSKTHRHVLATEHRCGAFAALFKTYAAQLNLAKATELLSLTDGAGWILNVLCTSLTGLMAMLLDIFHLSEHLHAAAKDCLGDTPEARLWVQSRLTELKTVGIRPLFKAIDELTRSMRSPKKREQLRILKDYALKRFEMLDYRAALAKGWDIGSGPTEAMCKTLTLRLKRSGMKWDADHAAAMMTLLAMRESNQHQQWWAMRARAA